VVYHCAVADYGELVAAGALVGLEVVRARLGDFQRTLQERLYGAQTLDAVRVRRNRTDDEGTVEA
jgi:hypothetical protein